MQYTLLAILMCLLLTGCGTKKSTFVLLPDPAGKVGEITITNDQGTRTLTEAKQSVVVNSNTDTPGETQIMDEAEIRALFSKAIDIQPPEPSKFIFYFKFDSVQLKPGSQENLLKVVQAAIKGNSLDISINGHTDRTGDSEYNYNLSYRRARQIKHLLEKQGIDSDIMATSSHGEGNPLIHTQDNVIEPRNRRVEVIVR